MKRTLTLIATALLGAACDELKPSTDATPRQDRMTATTRDPKAPREMKEGADGKDRLEADNSGLNTRDRNDTVTPMDQGQSTEEIAITADIRKNMMAESSLSFTAKNVKVMTIGNRVTLRGPVASAAEKTLIAAVAKRTSGVSDVDNQLEVKP
jgi:osmotically-inducible protein OsmY